MEQSIRTEFNHQSKEQITLLRGVPRGSLTTPAQTSANALVCAGAGAGLTAGLVLVFLAGLYGDSFS